LIGKIAFLLRIQPPSAKINHHDIKNARLTTNNKVISELRSVGPTLKEKTSDAEVVALAALVGERIKP
jgi:beta-galactosidase GanA